MSESITLCTPPELSEMCGQESSGQGLRDSTGRKI